MQQLAELREVVSKQGAEIERLKAQRLTTSRTSSKPPSSDSPWQRPKVQRKSSGRKPGGQPGHAPHQRPPAPAEDIDDVTCVKPEKCSCGGKSLAGDDPTPLRHQIFDIPPITPLVVEFLLHERKCATCGTATRAQLPAGVHANQFGPNVTALVCLLTSEYLMSRRSVQRLLSDSFGIDVSLGAISSMERRMSEGLAKPHADAMASVAASPFKHLDETTWRQNSDLAWVWTEVGDEATVFVIRDSRGSVVAQELVGDDPTGIVVTDRFSAYSHIDIDRRQVCLAHLVRHFRRIAEGEKELRRIGERLLGLVAALFQLWHLFQEDKIGRAQLIRWTRPIRVKMIRLLDEGAHSREYDTPARCPGILETERAMWTFVEREGVEPTNNAAERALRPMVIHRKTSLGSQSDRGSRYLERSHTVSAPLRRAGRSIHDFIHAVAKAVLGGGEVPTLLPKRSVTL
jgi:transposase